MSHQDVLHGSNLDLLAAVRDNFAHAVVTDPPYGLGFMGKDWDSALPDPRTWAECLRVLRPGGHLVAFGAPRLVHRLTCQIEDAGFEIRDQLLWVFAQGFPKSLDVAWEMHKNAGAWYGPMVESDHGQTLPEHNVRFVRATHLQAPVYACAQCGQVLQPRVPEQDSQGYRAAWFKSETSWAEQPGMEGRSHLEAPEGELSRCEVCSMRHGLLADGASGWVHHGAQTCDGPPPWAVVESDGSCPSYRPQSVEQLHRQPDAVSIERRAQTFRGFQTSLKPAYEPIVLARKPLDGTVAQTVQRWGTGAINVDGCRVGTTKDVPASPRGIHKSGSMSGALGTPPEGSSGFDPNVGRWPANLILDEAAGAMLDAQSGERPGAVSNGSRGGGLGVTSIGYGPQTSDRPQKPGRGDSGGASRFFARVDFGEVDRFMYCPKASRSEREAGLGHLPTRVVDPSREDDAAARDNPRTGAGRSGEARRNHHATVKPIDLMRWLVRLVTPPGGMVLEPFAGSGTTPAACALEDVDCLAMELDADYVEIARARVAHAVQQREEELAAKIESSRQMDLFAMEACS